MRTDWVPTSAALLVTGGMALALATLLRPAGDSGAETLRLVQENDGRWLAICGIYLLAATSLTLGLPSVLALLEERGRVLGLTALVGLAVGFLGIAGYAMLMVFFRATVVTGAIDPAGIERVSDEAGLLVFIFGWVVVFYLAELLLALALLRARTVPRWAPLLLVLHVAIAGTSTAITGRSPGWSMVLFALGLAGTGIAAADRLNR